MSSGCTHTPTLCVHTYRHVHTRTHAFTHTHTSTRTRCNERLSVEHAHSNTNICTYMYGSTHMINAVVIVTMPARTVRWAASTAPLCVVAPLCCCCAATALIRQRQSYNEIMCVGIHVRFAMGRTKHPKLSAKTARQCPYQIDYVVILRVRGPPA